MLPITEKTFGNCYKAALEMEDSEGKGRETISGRSMVSRREAVDHVNSGTGPWHRH